MPQPVQLQEPPDTGCGPNCTELPAATVTVAVCCHAPPFTRRYGVIAVGAQPPLEDELLEELELDELLELELDDEPPSRKASMATVGLRVFGSQAPFE